MLIKNRYEFKDLKTDRNDINSGILCDHYHWLASEVGVQLAARTTSHDVLSRHFRTVCALHCFLPR